MKYKTILMMLPWLLFFTRSPYATDLQMFDLEDDHPKSERTVVAPPPVSEEVEKPLEVEVIRKQRGRKVVLQKATATQKENLIPEQIPSSDSLPLPSVAEVPPEVTAPQTTQPQQEEFPVIVDSPKPTPEPEPSSTPVPEAINPVPLENKEEAVEEKTPPSPILAPGKEASDSQAMPTKEPATSLPVVEEPTIKKPPAALDEALNFTLQRLAATPNSIPHIYVNLPSNKFTTAEKKEASASINLQSEERIAFINKTLPFIQNYRVPEIRQKVMQRFERFTPDDLTKVCTFLASLCVQDKMETFDLNNYLDEFSLMSPELWYKFHELGEPLYSLLMYVLKAIPAAEQNTLIDMLAITPQDLIKSMIPISYDFYVDYREEHSKYLSKVLILVGGLLEMKQKELCQRFPVKKWCLTTQEIYSWAEEWQAKVKTSS